MQISTAAIQFADGSIDDGDIEPPSVAILDGDTDTGIQLNADQARKLASVLLAAADEVDGWAAR
ncbi:MAG: hypothetical protein ACLQIK_01160 [Mycobacterium sp.]|uniref:hypothetical protein n=1 Tax=Mycobacterium sp. TaxID=1785 RepID=UPI003F95ACC3